MSQRILILLLLIPLRIAAQPTELEKYLLAERDSRKPVDITNVEDFFSGMNVSDIEGVWRMSGSEGVFAVMASPGSIFYDIVAIDVPDQSVLPGAVIGACTPAGREDYYDAQMFTSAEGGKLSAPRRFTISLAAPGNMVIEPVTDRLKINFWRLLPYMFRHAVSHVNDRPNNLDGAIRVYPTSAESPSTPRYL